MSEMIKREDGGAMAPGPSAVPMFAIEGGSYPIESVDGPAGTRSPRG